MEEIVTVESGTQIVQGLPSGAAMEAQSVEQQKLADEIRRLWPAHVEAKAAARKAKAELRDIRRRLAGPLSEMKMLLAKPGRNGGWSSFLRCEGIAKATAERLARKGGEAGGTQLQAMPVSGTSLGEPSGASGSPSCGTGYGAAEAACPAPLPLEGDGNPADAPAADPAPQLSGDIPATAHEPPASAPTTDPAPQPSGGTLAAIEEPAVETAATPTEAGQPAEAAAEASGGDAALAPGGPGAAVAAAGDGGVL
jgi:hypothetical protein